jgi:hypothetical protein
VIFMPDHTMRHLFSLDKLLPQPVEGQLEAAVPRPELGDPPVPAGTPFIGYTAADRLVAATIEPSPGVDVDEYVSLVMLGERGAYAAPAFATMKRHATAEGARLEAGKEWAYSHGWRVAGGSINVTEPVFAPAPGPSRPSCALRAAPSLGILACGWSSGRLRPGL